jgi:hypothetical protein
MILSMPRSFSGGLGRPRACFLVGTCPLPLCEILRGKTATERLPGLRLGRKIGDWEDQAKDVAPTRPGSELFLLIGSRTCDHDCALLAAFVGRQSLGQTVRGGQPRATLTRWETRPGSEDPFAPGAVSASPGLSPGPAGRHAHRVRSRSHPPPCRGRMPVPSSRRTRRRRRSPPRSHHHPHRLRCPPRGRTSYWVLGRQRQGGGRHPTHRHFLRTGIPVPYCRRGSGRRR